MLTDLTGGISRDRTLKLPCFDVFLDEPPMLEAMCVNLTKLWHKRHLISHAFWT